GNIYLVQALVGCISDERDPLAEVPAEVAGQESVEPAQVRRQAAGDAQRGTPVRPGPRRGDRGEGGQDAHDEDAYMKLGVCSRDIPSACSGVKPAACKRCSRWPCISSRSACTARVPSASRPGSRPPAARTASDSCTRGLTSVTVLITAARCRTAARSSS